MNKITTIWKTVLLTLFLFSFLACSRTNEISIPDEKDKILKLHNEQRNYHFNKDSIAFTNQFSDNFISVNKGKISSPKRAETIARYNRYFASVEFVKWDDVSDPIIKFSDDGSMAYTIVDKVVVVSYKGENGKTMESETHFAWTSIYKKYEDEWKIDCVTSTDMPKTLIKTANY